MGLHYPDGYSDSEDEPPRKRVYFGNQQSERTRPEAFDGPTDEGQEDNEEDATPPTTMIPLTRTNAIRRYRREIRDINRMLDSNRDRDDSTPNTYPEEHMRAMRLDIPLTFPRVGQNGEMVGNDFSPWNRLINLTYPRTLSTIPNDLSGRERSALRLHRWNSEESRSSSDSATPIIVASSSRDVIQRSGDSETASIDEEK